LDSAIGGPSKKLRDTDNRRRTIYATISRSDLDRMLQLFDFPDPNVHSALRSLTITPLQKLFVMNSPFMLQNAESLAARLSESSENTREKIARAYAMLFARDPTQQELQLAVAFLGRKESRALSRWRQYAQVLLASNELMYVD
jgi:hypothetical protein